MVAGSAPLSIELRRRRDIARLEPLIADQQNGLGEVEAGEVGVERHGQDCASASVTSSLSRPMRSAPNMQADLAAGGDLLARISPAAERAVTIGFTMSRSRAVVA